MKDDDRNQPFTREVVASLDASLDQLDEITLRRLKKTRAAALAQKQIVAEPALRGTSRQKWLLSMAAGVALLAMVPMAWQHQKQTTYEQDVEMALQDVPITSEEMDDLDMLMALEDTDV